MEKCAPYDLSYQKYDREDWDSFLNEIQDDIDQPYYPHNLVLKGNALFAEDVNSIVVIGDEVYSGDDIACPSYHDVILKALNDFHITYIFNREQVLAIDRGNYSRLVPHQMYKVISQIRKEALKLGWIEN